MQLPRQAGNDKIVQLSAFLSTVEAHTRTHTIAKTKVGKHWSYRQRLNAQISSGIGQDTHMKNMDLSRL